MWKVQWGIEKGRPKSAYVGEGRLHKGGSIWTEVWRVKKPLLIRQVKEGHEMAGWPLKTCALLPQYEVFLVNGPTNYQYPIHLNGAR